MSITPLRGMADNRTNAAPWRSSSLMVSRTAGPPAPVRALRTHSAGESCSVAVSARSASSVPVIGPVDVLEQDEQRGLRCSGANCALKVVHNPIAEVGRTAQPRSASSSPTGGSACSVAVNSEKNGTVC